MNLTGPGLWLPFATAYAGIFGLLIGSFLNVVVFRVPNGLSIVSPPSACPTCGHVIKAYDNIPVLSCAGDAAAARSPSRSATRS